MEDPIVYHACFDRIQYLDPVHSTSPVRELPDFLLIAPGDYRFCGKSYSLRQEGLYRFIQLGSVNEQRIVLAHDVDRLLSSLAWITCHGNRDTYAQIEDALQHALHDKLSMTCSNTACLACGILQRLKVNTHVVFGINVDVDDPYNKSHTMNEIFRPDLNKWVAYDLDMSCNFTLNGTPLSFLEFCELIDDNNIEINYLSKGTNIDLSNFTTEDQSFNFAFFAEGLLDKNNLLDWYRRLLRVPMILHQKQYYFFDAARRKQIEKLGSQFHFMEKKTFLSTFYR